MASFAPAVAATTAGGHRICAGCDRRVSVTAGTIFDKTRTPLTVWFDAAWLLVNSKTGVSATQLRREMEPGSVQTAWAMLHRYRTVMVRPGRGRLRGDVEVEVDESFVGGPEPGVPERGAPGKVLFAAAVEVNEGRIGRARLGVIPDASTVSLAAFLDANVEPGSRVITDGWPAYPGATRDRYPHQGTSVADSGLHAHEVLRQAVCGEPVTYRSLRKAGRTRASATARARRATAPAQPGRGAAPAALARAASDSINSRHLNGNPILRKMHGYRNSETR